MEIKKDVPIIDTSFFNLITSYILSKYTGSLC